MPVVNDAALDLICSFEGWVPTWYKDPVGIWTCCYGHTDAAGEPKFAATSAKTFTKAEGRLILERDLAQYAAAVHAAVKVPLNDNQFGALVSFTYNLGAANLRKSTLVKKLNAGDYAGAAKEFARWDRAGGKVLPGLTKRRAAEAALFLAPVGKESAPSPEVPAAPSSPASGIWQAVAALLSFILSLFKRKP